MSKQFKQNNVNYYGIMYDSDLRVYAQAQPVAAVSKVTVSDNTMVLLLPAGYKGTPHTAVVSGNKVLPATASEVEEFYELAKTQDMYYAKNGNFGKICNTDCAEICEDIEDYIKYGDYHYFNGSIAGQKFWIDLAIRTKAERAQLSLLMQLAPEFQQVYVPFTSNFRAAQASAMYKIVFNHASELVIIIDNFELDSNVVGIVRTAMNNDVVVKLMRFVNGELLLARLFVPVRKQYEEIANQCFITTAKIAKRIMEVRAERQLQYSSVINEEMLDVYQAKKLYAAANPYETPCRDGYAEAVQQTMMFQNIGVKYQPRPMAKIDKNNKVANEKRAIAFRQMMNTRVQNAQNTVEDFLKDAEDQNKMLQLIRDYGKALGFNVSTTLEKLNDASTFTIFQNKGKRVDTSYTGSYDYQIKIADYLKYTAQVNDNVLKNLPDVIRAAFEIDWFINAGVEQFLDDGYRLCPVCGKPLSVNARTCKCGYEQVDAVEIAEGNPEFISGTMQTVRPERSLTEAELQMVAKAVEIAGLPQDRKAVAATKQLMHQIATKPMDFDTAVRALQDFYYGRVEAEEQVAVTENKPVQTDIFAQFQDTKCYLSKAAMTAYIKFYSVRKAEAKAVKERKSNKNNTKLIEVTTDKGNKFSIYVAK